jgi:hypothetical protein
MQAVAPMATEFGVKELDADSIARLFPPDGGHGDKVPPLFVAIADGGP